MKKKSEKKIVLSGKVAAGSQECISVIGEKKKESKLRDIDIL